MTGDESGNEILRISSSGATPAEDRWIVRVIYAGNHALRKAWRRAARSTRLRLSQRVGARTIQHQGAALRALLRSSLCGQEVIKRSGCDDLYRFSARKPLGFSQGMNGVLALPLLVLVRE